MITCLNTNLPIIQEELFKLIDILGDANAAYAVLALNNGYGLDKAPNGQESKLFKDLIYAVQASNPALTSDQAYIEAIKRKVLCYSPSFREWFGDWVNNPDSASKVVDANKEPLLVFHHTDKTSLSEFDPEFLNYFAKNGGTKHAFFFDENRSGTLDRSYDMPVFLNIRDLTTFVGTKEDLHNQGTTYRELVNTSAATYPVTGGLHMSKFDDNRMEDQDVWIAHHPNQIKSAVANNGQFSSSNNIYQESIIIDKHYGKEFNIQTSYQDSELYTLYKRHNSGDFFGSRTIPMDMVLQHLNAVSTENSQASAVIKLLTSQLGADIFKDIQIIIEPGDLYQNHGVLSRAFYDSGTKTIVINRDAYFRNGDASQVILHELLHAITVDKIYSDPVLLGKFQQVLNDYQNKYHDPRYEGDQGLAEFIANIWSDPKTISNLRNTKSPRKANWTLWQQIRQYLSDVFYNLFGGTSKYDTLFAEASTLLLELFETQSTEIEAQLYEESIDAPNGDLKGYINHSGGAIGSDSVWGIIGKQYGVESKHYYIGQKTPRGNTEIKDQRAITTAKQNASKASKSLGRNDSTSVRTSNLIARNWFQVANSDAIFAIGTIKRFIDKETGKQTRSPQVNGGTGYAVQMAINDLPSKHRDIYVFDQKDGVWYVYDKATKDFVLHPQTPVLPASGNFAGIGTREINVAGLQAIKDVYKASVQQKAKKVVQHPGKWTRAEVANDKQSLYIFSDNTNRTSGTRPIPASSEYAQKYGQGLKYPEVTQAVIRGLDNAMPISTQKKIVPKSMASKGNWSDAEFNQFKEIIDSEIEAIKEKWDSGNYTRLVIGEYFNTDIANISLARTPKIYTYLKRKLNELYDHVNGRPSQIHVQVGGKLVKNTKLSGPVRDLLALQQYQYSKEGMTPDEIYIRQMAYLQRDPEEIKRVKRFVDLVQMRQAQLHILGKDLGPESRINGVFDWDTYLVGIDLRYDINEQSVLKHEQEASLNPESKKRRFGIIEDYTVDPAEIIMPKLYKSQFKLGNKDIADIDVDYFKSHTNSHYYTRLKDRKGEGVPLDLLVRTHTSAFNVIFSDTTVAPTEGLQIVYPTFENDQKFGWRLDAKGDRMYEIPEELDYVIYKDKTGQETIVIKKTDNAESLCKELINSIRNLVSVQLFAENIQPTSDWIHSIISWNQIKTNNSALRRLSTSFEGLSPEQVRAILLNIYKQDAGKYKNDLANTLYNSFVKSLYLISVRIPTQAFQSIMAVKVAGLTNDDFNNVFVTRWQFWLQGSDLDIDKSYLMGVDISSIGTYNHWSPLADYTSESLAKISDELPLPNGKKLVLPQEVHTVKGRYELIQLSAEESRINTLIEYYLAELDDEESEINSEDGNKYLKKKEHRLSILVDLIKEINKTHQFVIRPDLYADKRVQALIKQINRHNTHELTAAESRNVIQKSIVQASLDERNIKASYSPIDVVMKRFQNELNKIEDESSLSRNLDDGISVARMQYNNSVGKQDVGVMANGLKAFFALTQYFNKKRNDPGFVRSRKYFLSRLHINGEDRYFSSISDIKFDQEALSILKSSFKQYFPNLSEDLTFTADDASLLISSLVSLATDNAKELALAKMNASIELASMHLFLVVMGYSPQEVIEFTTSSAFNKVVQVLNKSAIVGKKMKVPKAIGKVLASKGITEEERRVLAEMRYVYSCAQEMSKVAKLAAINQGVKVDELEADKFYTIIESTLREQVDRVCPATQENPVSFNVLDDFSLQLKEVGMPVMDDGYGKLTDDSVIMQFLVNTHNYNETEISQTLIEEYKAKLANLNERNQQMRYIGSDLSIDMFRYFQDEEYKQFIIDLYDFFKHNFNVLDCINELPHFSKMLEAFVLSEETIKQHSSRARAVLEQSKHAYIGDRLSNYAQKVVRAHKDPDDPESPPLLKNYTAFDKKPYGTDIQRKAGRFYDDYVLSEWIKEYGQQIKITRKTKQGSRNITETIDLTTNEGIVQFANFMAYSLIPQLIEDERFEDNLFLKYIIPDFKQLRKGQSEKFLPKYVFSFDVDTLTSVSDQNKAFYINQGFYDLSGWTLGQIDKDVTVGSSLTLGELFCIYDRLCNMASIGQGSLDRAFELYLAKKLEAEEPTMIAQLGKLEQQHDTGERPEVVFDPLLFTAFCYSTQIRTKQQEIMKYDYNYDGTKKCREFSIKGKYLFHIDTVDAVQDAQVLSETLLQGIVLDKIQVTIQEGKWKLTSYNDADFQYEFDSSSNVESKEGLIRDLAIFAQQNPQEFEDFKADLETGSWKDSPSNLKGHQTVQTYRRFEERMAKLGVEVISKAMGQTAPSGYVENGVIYLNSSKQITAVPMHELMHLVFGVMKHDNFKQYERVLELAMNSPMAQKIMTLLLQTPEYQNMMDLDQKEEVFCRMLEIISNKKGNTQNLFVDTEGNDIYEQISSILSPYIGKTFGIEPPKFVAAFLMDTVSALPSYGSTLFMRQKSDSTGYLANKQKVIQSAKIKGYIEDLIKTEQLIKTEC